MLAARETVTSRKNGRGYRVTITGGDWAREWPVDNKAPPKETYARWSKDDQKMHLQKVSSWIIGDPRATVILPGMFLLGKHEKKGDGGRQVIPEHHGPRFRQLIEMPGEASRGGENRKARSP